MNIGTAFGAIIGTFRGKISATAPALFQQIGYQAAETDGTDVTVEMSDHFTGTITSVDVSAASDFSSGTPSGISVGADSFTFDWSVIGALAQAVRYVRVNNASGSVSTSFKMRVIAPLGASELFLGVGLNHGFRFNLKGTDDPAKPVLINHHGLSGMEDGTSYNATTFCSTYGLASFGPHFPDGDYAPGWPTTFTSSQYQKGGVAYLEADIIAAVRKHLDQPSKPALVYGHSAGGQWVSRVVAYAPVTGVQQYVAANPSTWVFPVRTGQNLGYPELVASPYGFDGMGANAGLRDAAIAAYLQRPMTVYIGSEDNDPEDVDLDISDEGMAQGAHRLERAQNVYAAAQAAATRLGVSLAWQYVVANGVGHAGTSMLNAPEIDQAMFP